MKRTLIFSISFVFILVAGIVNAHLTPTSGEPHKPPISASYNNQIISDLEFRSKNTMTEAQIQAFLVSKGSALANYTIPMDWSVPTAIGPGDTVESRGWAASKVIYMSAQWYNINPQVLLATLQKESSLVTSGNLNYINAAMGMGCPEGSGCSTYYKGFARQMDGAAYQLDYNFRYSELNDANRVGQYRKRNTATVDGKSTYINNSPTAALYRYTPHRPDSAQMYDSWGNLVTDHYYGNYNFIYYFNKWFDIDAYMQSALSLSDFTITDANGKSNWMPALGETITISYDLTNNTDDPMTFTPFVGGRYNGENRDYGWTNSTVLPGESARYMFPTTVTDLGYVTYFPAVSYNGAWVSYTAGSIISRSPNLAATGAVSVSSNVTVGQSADLSVTIRNNEDVPINFQTLLIAVRRNGAYEGYDTGAQTGSIGAGLTKTLAGTVTYKNSGNFSAWPSMNIGGNWIDIPRGYNTLLTNWTVNPLNQYLTLSDFTITDANDKSDWNPALGQTITISYSLTNRTSEALSFVPFVGARYNAANRDYGWTTSTVLAGESARYLFPTTVNDLGNIQYFPSVSYNGSWISYSGGVITSRSPNLAAVGAVNIDPLVATSGQNATLTVVVRNNEDVAINFRSLIIAVRRNSAYEGYDTGAQSGSIAAGTTKTLIGSITYKNSGAYSAWPSMNIGVNWVDIPRGYKTLLTTWTVN